MRHEIAPFFLHDLLLLAIVDPGAGPGADEGEEDGPVSGGEFPAYVREACMESASWSIGGGGEREMEGIGRTHHLEDWVLRLRRGFGGAGCSVGSCCTCWRGVGRGVGGAIFAVSHAMAWEWRREKVWRN